MVKRARTPARQLERREVPHVVDHDRGEAGVLGQLAARAVVAWPSTPCTPAGPSA
jgi:hypothetical protein